MKINSLRVHFRNGLWRIMVMATGANLRRVATYNGRQLDGGGLKTKEEARAIIDSLTDEVKAEIAVGSARHHVVRQMSRSLSEQITEGTLAERPDNRPTSPETPIERGMARHYDNKRKTFAEWLKAKKESGDPRLASLSPFEVAASVGVDPIHGMASELSRLEYVTNEHFEDLQRTLDAYIENASSPDPTYRAAYERALENYGRWAGATQTLRATLARYTHQQLNSSDEAPGARRQELTPSEARAKLAALKSGLAAVELARERNKKEVPPPPEETRH